MAKLKFEFGDDVSAAGRTIQAGCFSRNWDEEEAVDALHQQIAAGMLTLDQSIVQGNALLTKYPDNLEIANFLANRYWNAEMKTEAAEVYATAFQKAVKLIPKDFTGRISWLDIDNRPFLRIAHGHLLCLMRQRNGRRASALANKLLRWCPDDNLGVRYLLGDIKMIAGDFHGALKAYLTEAPTQPVSWYPAALIAFRLGDFIQSCTYLRRGIAGNPYVAEALTGRTLLLDHLYFHASNRQSCEYALDYLESVGNDWKPDECDFVDWVFNSAAVLRERATLMEIREALTHEHDLVQRDPWVTKFMSFPAGIDDQLSKTLVRKVVNRWGDEIWPWDRSGSDPRAAFQKAHQAAFL